MKITMEIDVNQDHIMKILRAYSFEVETVEKNPDYDPSVPDSPVLITKTVTPAKLKDMYKNHLKHTILSNFSLLLNDSSVRDKFKNISDDIYYADSKYLNALVKVKFKGA